MIKLLCKNRQVIRTDNQWVVEYSRNVDPIAVTFDDEWKGLSISVTFRNGEIGPYTLDYVEGMKIPPQFLETGEIQVSFTGRKSYDDDLIILRTGEMKYPILCHKAGDAISMPPPDLPPDIWEQAIAKVDEALKNSQIALDQSGVAEKNSELALGQANLAVKNSEDALTIVKEVRDEFENIRNKIVPDGGLEGQILGKFSDTDGDYGWMNQPEVVTDWENLHNKPFDGLNANEMEVLGESPDRQLGIKEIPQYKVSGLATKLIEIDESLKGKQPTGDYATRSELPTKTSELTNDSDFATNKSVSDGLGKKLELTGGTMQGKIDMASFGIFNLPDAIANGEPVTFKQLNDAIAGIGTVFNLKGSKPNYEALPKDGNKIGDVWFVEDESVGYIWIEKNGVPQWEQFGPSIDLSGYLAKDGLLQTTGTETKNAMSQDATTKALKLKADASDVSKIPVVKVATGTILTSANSIAVAYTGTFLQAFANMNGEEVLTNVKVEADKVTFSTGEKPKNNVVCNVIYM